MKKILFVVDEKMMGGVSIVLENLLWSLYRKEYEIDVAVLHNRGNCLADIPEGVKIVPGSSFFDSVDFPISEILKMKDYHLLLNKLRLIFYMKTGLIKKRIIKERDKMKLGNYDCEVAFKDGFTALFTAFGNTSNKIHWLHYEYKLLNPNAKYDRLFKEALPKFKKIVAVSEGVMNCFNDIYHLEEKTIVIANLINTEMILKKARGVSHSKKDNLLFISVGRLHMQKGYDRLLNVLAKLKNEKNIPSNFHFNIYGDGPMREQLKNMTDTLALNDIVSFKGQVLNPFQYIKDADVFILSSLYEPFGLVIVEAMTLGIPVLATENAATSELIDTNRNGLIVNNSEEGLYEGLLYLLKNPEAIQSMKNELQSYEYDNSNIVMQIEELF